MKKQIGRLKRLIEHLKYIEENDPEAFSLSQWFVSQNPDSFAEAVEKWPLRGAAKQPLQCGTSACVVGHLPVVFPEYFAWIQTPPLSHSRETSGRVVVKTPDTEPAYVAAEEVLFFGTSPNDVTCSTLATFFGAEEPIWSLIIYDSEYPPEVRENGEVPLRCVLARLKDVLRELENTPEGMPLEWSDLNWETSATNDWLPHE